MPGLACTAKAVPPASSQRMAPVHAPGPSNSAGMARTQASGAHRQGRLPRDADRIGRPCAVDPALRLPADGRDFRPLPLSPPHRRVATICASPAATGRGWRHPTFTCGRSGARKESEMAQDPGSSLRRLVRGASNGAQAAGSRRPLRFGKGPPGPESRADRSGTENRRCAGAERQPVGRETAPGELTGSPWLRSRRSRTRRTSPATAGRAAWCCPVEARREERLQQPRFVRLPAGAAPGPPRRACSSGSQHMEGAPRAPRRW
jgi:hypothetical protein